MSKQYRPTRREMSPCHQCGRYAASKMVTFRSGMREMVCGFCARFIVKQGGKVAQ